MSVDQTWAVELEHRVAGAPEEVFEYFIDPDKYRRWKGSEAELDPRPGGSYRVTMGPQIWVGGKYVAVEPPRRLVMTWGFESPHTLPRGMAQVPPGTSSVEFTFTSDGDDTLIRVRHVGLPTEEAQFAHELGWNTYLARLAVVRKGDEPDDDPVADMGEVLFAKDAERSPE